MLWSRHIIVSLVMVTRGCKMRPTRIVDQRTEVHKTTAQRPIDLISRLLSCSLSRIITFVLLYS
ncbi:unnamed protein product [Callosobruchus maculatus]|uniref:Uncharacterized protein n=1 Tax=Callosobruchus maculatus TaxID=64391 RepID=A0A653D5H0_CALMS|nr:unnamed protein product [Callosobruchus maculatus]